MTLSHKAGPKTRPQIVAVTVIILAITLLYACTMRRGRTTDDDPQYIQHAKNISDRAPYDRIPWVFNEGAWNPGPRVYPPIFPLFLAPVYRRFGLDLKPMKILIAIFFVGSLIVIYLTFRAELGLIGSFSVITIIGFSYFFWDFKDFVLSDIPFLFLYSLALLLVQAAISREDCSKPFVAYSILAGLTMYLACGTRSVGVVMIPAALTWSLTRYIRIKTAIIIPTVICAAIIFGEATWLHTYQAYAKGHSHESSLLVGLFSAARFYLGSLSALLWAGQSQELRIAVLIFTLVMASAGLVVHLSRNFQIYDVFGLFYMPTLLYAMEARYLIPLVPLLIFYATLGFLWLTRQASTLYKALIRSTVAVAVALALISSYYNPVQDPTTFNTEATETRQMFDFIRNQTTSGDIIDFQAPRVLALYTGRRSSTYDGTGVPTKADLTRYFCEVGITYVLVSPGYGHASALSDLTASSSTPWSIPFKNSGFVVYRVPAGICQHKNTSS